METPSSTRIVTRSQLSKNNIQSSSKESRQRKTGQALIDITNDSPIVGLTSGNLKTPLTSARRGMNTSKVTMTPGSGEALLRGQVKNLLQMVEEETEIQKLQQLPCRPFVGIYRVLNDCSSSPITLLAPANTPQIVSSSVEQKFGFNLPSPIIQDPIFLPQETFEAKSPLTRSLMLEFLEKDESDFHTTVTNVDVTEIDVGSNEKSVLVVDDDDDIDDSSIWSTQVNASTEDEYEYEDVDDEVVYKDENDEYECADYENADTAEDLCSEMSTLSVNGESKLPIFTGKHIRFEYNSDDEDEEEEATDNSKSAI